MNIKLGEYNGKGYLEGIGERKGHNKKQCMNIDIYIQEFVPNLGNIAKTYLEQK